YRLWAVQLDDVWRTQGVLIGAAQTNIRERCPLHLELVGICGTCRRVARMPVAGIEYQLLGPRLILHDRYAQLRELLRHADVLVVDRDRGAAEARQVVRYRGRVGLKVELIEALLRTHVDRHPIAGERNRYSVLAEIPGDAAGDDCLAHPAGLGAETVEVGDLIRRYCALLEQLVGNAATASAQALSARADIQGIVDRVPPQEVGVGLLQTGVVVGEVSVVIPGIPETAGCTDNDAIVVVLPLGRARTALDVAPPDPQRHVSRRRAVLTAVRGERCGFLCTEQRAVAGHVDTRAVGTLACGEGHRRLGVRGEEQSRRRGRCLRLVVHVVEFELVLHPVLYPILT